VIQEQAERMSGRVVLPHGTDEAIEVIVPLAEAGDVARTWWVRWLAELGRAGGLRELAGDGDDRALLELAGWLAHQGRLGELRGLAEGNGAHARRLLLSWLSEQNDIDVLRVGAELGDERARALLARWQARREARAGRWTRQTGLRAEH